MSVAQNSLAHAIPTAPMVLLTLALSVTTGFVDAIGVLAMGQVFLANMAGNLVFLGFAFAGSPAFDAQLLAFSLGGFVVGVLVAGIVAGFPAARSLRHTLLVAGFVEGSMLAAGAAIAVSSGVEVGDYVPRPELCAIIFLTALAMGLRTGTVRRIGFPELAPTVLTLAMSGLAPGSLSSRRSHRIICTGTMFAGALVGAVMVLRDGLATALLVAAALIVSATVMAVTHPDFPREGDG